MRELTEGSRAGGAPKKVVEAVLAVAGAGDAIPHLQHGDLRAEAHLRLQLLHFLQRKVSRCLRHTAVGSYVPYKQHCISAQNGEGSRAL